MGLFAKVKDILFEEEEVTEPIKKVKEEKKEVKKEQPKEETPISRQIQPEKKEESPIIDTPPKPKNIDDLSERELFRSENRSPFLDFDEEEFDNSVSRPSKPKPTTNVLEYERKKRTEKRTDYGRVEKTEVREVVEKKKFRPSPIISPVYGVLNEDYKIEDIKDKKTSYSDNLDIDSVRRKAFESSRAEKLPDETYYEETVTVKVKEPMETKAQKVKTIDELLEESSDLRIELDDEDKHTRSSRNKEYDDIDEELESIINQPPEKPKREIIEHDDDDATLENDLFDLIDSMYDSREEDDY